MRCIHAAEMEIMEVIEVQAIAALTCHKIQFIKADDIIIISPTYIQWLSLPTWRFAFFKKDRVLLFQNESWKYNLKFNPFLLELG